MDVVSRAGPAAFVVSGLRSGVGKTTVTLGLIRAFSNRGLRVAALKIGPDFLDPSHYSGAGAVFVRNLDPILQTVSGMKNVFSEAEHFDVVVVEGAMGLFDGPFPGKITASAADIAHRLRLPVLLVCDSRSCAQSVAAELVGARALLGHGRGRPPLLGAVLNFVASPRHAELLLKGVEKLAKIPAAGCLFRDTLPALPSRHLGLVPATEVPAGKNDLYEKYGNAVAASLPLNSLLRAASRRRSARPPRPPKRELKENLKSAVTVGIAQDEVFSFYYPETIEYFQRYCRRVIFFSPLRDKKAPEADLYYFGGGFPEVFAERLCRNVSFRTSMAHRLAKGAKAYAECGGLMYLSKSIATSDGKVHPMVGAILGRCVMHKRRQALGYWKARIKKKTLFLEKDMVLVGHEYHWSSFEADNGLEPIMCTQKIGSDERGIGGWAANSVFASYLHLSPYGNPAFFKKLVSWSETKEKTGTVLI